MQKFTFAFALARISTLYCVKDAGGNVLRFRSRFTLHLLDVLFRVLQVEDAEQRPLHPSPASCRTGSRPVGTPPPPPPTWRTRPPRPTSCRPPRSCTSPDNRSRLHLLPTGAGMTSGTATRPSCTTHAGTGHHSNTGGLTDGPSGSDRNRYCYHSEMHRTLACQLECLQLGGPFFVG